MTDWLLQFQKSQDHDNVEPTPNYRSRSLAKQGDNALGSVRPPACPSVSALTPEPFDLDILSAFVDNCADAVNRLLLLCCVQLRKQ